MAKRVLQADGTYCYTENCRIHDRSFVSSTGTKAIVADAENHSREITAKSIQQTLTQELGVKENTSEIASAAIHTIYSGQSISANEIANIYAQEVFKDKDLTNKDIDKLYKAAYRTHNELFQNSLIKQNDEVVLNTTGQRGRVMEGNSFMGGLVRVETEDSGPGNYEWHNPADVTKIHPNTDGLTRERITSTARDGLLPKESVLQLLDEETNPKVRNAQGIHGLKDEEAEAVRSELLEIGNKFQKGFTASQLTKARLARYLTEEARVDRSWLPEQAAKNVKNALYTILNYVKPAKHEL